MASAPTYNQYSALVDATTIQQFMNGAFDNVVKRNILLAELEKRGNLKKDASGKYLERRARVGVHTAGYRSSDLAERAFSRQQQYVTYAIPYAIREIPGVLSEEDVQFNSGKEAQVSLKETLLKTMGEDFRRDINTQLLQSNAATNTVFGVSATAGSPVPIFGLPTIFGYGSAATGYNAATQASTGSGVAADDQEVLPNDIYCGINTHPTNAISGVTNRQNESTSPVIVNYTSTGFGSTTTWAANALTVIDYMTTRLTRSSDEMDAPTLGIMDRTMFNAVRKLLQANYRIELSGRPKSVSPQLFGDNRIPYGSFDLGWDASQPASVFYLLNTNHLEFNTFPTGTLLKDGTLSNGLDSMFTARTQYDIRQGAHLAVAGLTGQVWANPYFQGAAYAFA